MPRESSNDEITLGLLSAVEADGKISQRALSNELGVALGLANAYLKRCVRKGYIKIQQVPRRRYGYYLTPQGFAEKARLTAEYLTSSLTFFRRARAQLGELMEDCSRQGQSRIALIGASEIAEIATLTAHDHAVALICVVDPGTNREVFYGLPVVRLLSEMPQVDAAIVTTTGDIGDLCEQLRARLGQDRVHVPRLVRLDHLKQTGKKSRSAKSSAEARESVESGE